METRHASFSATPGQKLDIRCDHGSVTVRDGPAGNVAVAAALRNPEAWEYSAVEEQGAIVVVARLKPGYRFSPRGLASLVWDNPRAEIEVVAPVDAIPAVVVANATVDIEGMRNGCSVRTSNGGVLVSDCSGSLRVETSNGATQLVRLSGDISVETTNGRVSAKQLEGSVHVQTSNGRVDIELAPEPATESTVRTSNGSVAIGIASPANVDVSVSTLNGRSSVELPASRSEGDGQRARLSVRTSNGSVHVYESGPVYV